MRLARSARLASSLTLLALPALARADWLHGEDATSDWGGVRTRLDDHGVHVDVDYAAEGFVRARDGDGAYRGNLDLMLTLDTEKLGLWPGGELLVYGQNGHLSGLSDELQLVMPVSNLEAPDFTQLSELWLDQRLGEHVELRLGKQDANRDFAGPRYGGNYLNSSFGVIPTVPMPSFPAPALGGALMVQPTPWMNVRAGVYEGASAVEEVVGSGFAGDDGVFAVGALVFEHDHAGRPVGTHTLGVWRHTGQDRWGGYTVADLRLYVAPDDPADERSVQLFARGGWASASPDAPDLYVGGGVTAHGFLGDNNTVGVGAGYTHVAAGGETFIELFFKLRTIPWFTVEPDAQVYFTERGTELAVGLRTKLKL